MESKYNKRSPAVKRLMREAIELREPTEQYYAQPLQDNLFEWHFSVRGPTDSPFALGVYHGRILLPSGYPLQPPEIILLTPSGRFEVGKKVCLSISGHHPETWQPSWSIRTALLALIGFMTTRGEGALGSLDYPPSEQLLLALRSRETCCDVCGAKMDRVLLERTPVNAKTVTTVRPAVETTSRTQTTDAMTTITQTTAMENIKTNTMATFSSAAVTSAANTPVCAASATTTAAATIITSTEGIATGKTDVESSVQRVGQENIPPELHHRGTTHPASLRSSLYSSSTSQAVYAPANLCSYSSHMLSAVLVIVIAIALAFLILRRLSRETGF
uniref:Ubiquitin-conjugating enzyme E2, J1 n=1 Tax=Eptatretus burgeri TaxID=7764 RepID=A0A8C4QL29_EPTBU